MIHASQPKGSRLDALEKKQKLRSPSSHCCEAKLPAPDPPGDLIGFYQCLCSLLVLNFRQKFTVLCIHFEVVAQFVERFFVVLQDFKLVVNLLKPLVNIRIFVSANRDVGLYVCHF